MNTFQRLNFKLVRASLLLLMMTLLSACNSLSGYIKDGNMVEVQRMIVEGTDVNKDNNQGHAPLYTAAVENNVEAIKILLDAGADLNQSKALIGAVARNKINAVQFLLEVGANVNITDKSGGTPLLYAANYAPNLISDLIKHGADVNQQNYLGSTPLFYIAHFQLDGKGFKALIEAGANQSITRPDGDTALMWAINANNHTVAALLKNDLRNKSDWLNAKKLNTLQAYEDYLQKHDITSHREEANLRITEIQAERDKVKIAKQIKKEVQQANELAKLRKQSLCKLRDNNWIYTSGKCSKKYANGTGKAITTEGLSFEGRFKNGYRTFGKLLINNVLMYDGPIEQGKPHGSGICIHKGEPEDCNYYQGKRTDSLFKQRIEFAEQRKIMQAQQDQLEEKLALLGDGSRGTGSKTAMGLVTDAAKKRAADEAVNYLFDKLF